MLQFVNRTPFVGTVVVAPDPAGVETMYTVVKGTFRLGPTLEPADEQVPIAPVDEYYGDPAATSIKVPSDVSLLKPGTDVLLVGHAHATKGYSAREMDVTLTVGSATKTVRVTGDRVWQSTGAGEVMSDPEPFTMMPLVL